MKNPEKSPKTINTVYRHNNKRDFSAKSLSLLLLALRPRLFGVVLVATLSIILQICHTSPTFAASITLSIPKSLSLDITPTSTATYKKSTSNEIKISTDAPFGYELSIKSKDSVNKNTLINGSNKLPSITTAISEATYQASGDNNTWGYIPSKFNSSANANVHPGPTDTGDSLDKTSTANASTDNTYTIALAAKIDSTLPAGTYKNTFIISASANSVNYSVTYNLNSGTNGPSNIPNTSTTNNTITLENKTPTRSGYEFLGWCDKSTSTESCPGQTYQPGQTYTLTNSANAINLYAMWKTNAPTTMQDFNNYCSSMSTNQTLTLIDKRDSNAYTVAKLADGKCWMTQNLRLGKSFQMVLSSSDTDILSSYTLPASSTQGFSNNDAQNIYIDNSNSSYGGYYTYATATAGTNPSSGEATQSICPKGWQLPTETEADNLTKRYTYSTIAQSPANFILSGCYDDNSPCVRGIRGFWWCSTASSRNYATVLVLDSENTSNNGFYVLSLNYKSGGYSIRCISQQ